LAQFVETSEVDERIFQCASPQSRTGRFILNWNFSELQFVAVRLDLGLEEMGARVHALLEDMFKSGAREHFESAGHVSELGPEESVREKGPTATYQIALPGTVVNTPAGHESAPEDTIESVRNLREELPDVFRLMTESRIDF
jgi:hypothetical protein